jgi:hypothetical protein
VPLLSKKTVFLEADVDYDYDLLDANVDQEQCISTETDVDSIKETVQRDFCK